jgi:hypothetical protein
MSVSYFAYLCYPRGYLDDENDSEPIIKFEQPAEWKYEKVLPIQFSILHIWTDKDKGLYE